MLNKALTREQQIAQLEDQERLRRRQEVIDLQKFYLEKAEDKKAEEQLIEYLTWLESEKQWKVGKIYVATKARPVVWPSPADDAPQMRGRFPEWYLRDNIEKSLRRLGVERIDMFQLHSFMPSALVELDWLETLMKLKWLCR